MVSGAINGVCGRAFLDAYKYGDNAFGLVRKGCQTIVTGRKVGHNFGAHHNKEIDSGADEGFEYGYLISNAPPYRGYATIMA
jgi:hypothetical protein